MSKQIGFIFIGVVLMCVVFLGARKAEDPDTHVPTLEVGVHSHLHEMKSAAEELSELKVGLQSHLYALKQRRKHKEDAKSGGLGAFGLVNTHHESKDHHVSKDVPNHESSTFGLPLNVGKSPPKTLEEPGKSEQLLAQQGSHNQNKALEANQRGSLASLAADFWSTGLKHKMQCILSARGGVLLYHMRKAAGTSIRDVLEQFVARQKISLYETEGLTLDRRFLTFGSPTMGAKGNRQNSALNVAHGNTEPELLPELASKGSLLSVITLRDPVTRILSLYWYEHVGWFDGIQHKPEKCATLEEWVETWRDGSSFKSQFVSKNPYSTYVEIENYYVKSLIGWKDTATDGILSEKHLEQAKSILDSFDIVLLTEWMADISQINVVNALFPGRNIIGTKQLVKGDKKARERLQGKLAANVEEIKEKLVIMNALDIALFQYAQSLVSKRLVKIPQILKQAKDEIENRDQSRLGEQCGPKIHKLPRELDAQLGIHRPPGHKAPLK